jgi:hypothetical protein
MIFEAFYTLKRASYFFRFFTSISIFIDSYILYIIEYGTVSYVVRPNSVVYMINVSWKCNVLAISD